MPKKIYKLDGEEIVKLLGKHIIDLFPELDQCTCSVELKAARGKFSATFIVEEEAKP